MLIVHAPVSSVMTSWPANGAAVTQTLEVGIGTGRNVEHYPVEVHVPRSTCRRGC